MAWAMIAVSIAGMVLQMSAQQKAAAAQKQAMQANAAAAQFEADQLAQNAGQERASAQRRSLEEQRRAQLVASRALALSAAGGGGVSDPTVANLLADIAGEGAYRSAVALYQGEDRAHRLELGAAGKGYESQAFLSGANMASRAAMYGAAGSALTSGASLYERYGMGGPTTSGATYDATQTMDSFTDPTMWAPA